MLQTVVFFGLRLIFFFIFAGVNFKLVMKKIFIILMLIVIGVPVLAQIDTDRAALEQFANEQNQEWQKARKRAEKYAKDNNIELRVVMNDGTIMQLVDVENGLPVYSITDNIGAAITTRANELWPEGNVGVAITGEGFDQVGMWDGGAIYVQHQEFNNTGSARVTQADYSYSISDHATHVCGTIIAGGVDADAKGMAYLAEIKAYDWDNVDSEMSTAASNGMVISNHSWGYITGWNSSNGQWTWTGDASVSPNEDYKFGYYNSNSRSWDIICRNAPYFLIVKSAGNDRGDGPDNAGTAGVPEIDGGTDGYDCISAAGLAKNVITIGAVEKVYNYTSPSDVVMSSFSAWGPTDDGRIKPDVVACGVDVYSSIYDGTGTATYDEMSGTSMSSPNATGTLVLLHQLYQQQYNSTMRSSTIKGLVIHTADECGNAPGPDYTYGWGLINAERAGVVILEDAMQNTIDEIALANGNSYERTVSVSGNAPLRATICWTDLQGTIGSPSLNNRTPKLVNDLDLRIVDQAGNTYYPYKLDPENPSAAATTDSKNSVDNVEHIFIDAPEAGSYTIIVDHVGTISGGEQIFSLVISGIDEYSDIPECTEILVPGNESATALVNQEIKWRRANFATSYDVYFGTDGEGTSLPTNIYNGENIVENSFFTDLTPETTYYLAIYPKNSHGTNTSCNTIYSFTPCTINEFPYLADVEDVIVPDLPTGWQAIDSSERQWVSSNITSQSGSKCLVCMTTNGQSGPMNNMLITPPVAVEAGNEYLLKFGYHGFYTNTPESLKVMWGLAPTMEALTNEAFVNESINFNSWRDGEALVAPGIDGYIFFGFYLNTASGKGLFIDDVTIENWGPIAVEEVANSEFNIYYQSGNIFVNCLEHHDDLNITIVNTLGQEVLNAELSNVQNEIIDFENVAGVYFVTVSSKNQKYSKKILVK